MASSPEEMNKRMHSSRDKNALRKMQAHFLKVSPCYPAALLASDSSIAFSTSDSA